MRDTGPITAGVGASLLVSLCLVGPAAGQVADSFPTGRGIGQPTSMFGTYIRRGELLVYPFFEYYRDHDFEYKPSELGYRLERDFRGRFRASEGVLFVGIGLTDWLAIEIEAATISARLDRAAGDTSGLPIRLEESGRGDVEGQIRLRWAKERGRRPELFSYFEVVSPNRAKVLIGTPDWEFKFGTGLVRDFTWGTVTVRAAMDYGLEEKTVAVGEYAVEYLKRLSRSWRVYLGVEGSEDEVSAIGEIQWRLARGVVLKINNGFGLTSKATDWAPEVGLLLAVPLGR